MRGLLKRIAATVLCGIFALTPLTAHAAPIATGIDVSYHNGIVNWQAVKNSGINFAFVRVASTKSGIDRQFVNNITGANAAGLRVGVYIYSYATTVEGAINEANIVLNAIAPYTVSFPVVYDIEDTVHKNMSPDQLAALVNAFCGTIAAAGYYPMVYSSRNWMVQRIAPVPWDKWIAQYNTVNTYPGPYGVWQYTSHGAVNGVATRVDMNYLFTDYSQILIPEGFATQGGRVYYYQNYRKRMGWILANGGKYFAGPDFAVVSGWFNDGTGNYYLNPAEGGKASVGWTGIADKFYFFDLNGVMQVGLQNIGTQIVYLDATGAAQKGFITLPDGVHYFDNNYAMHDGLTGVGEMLYYFNDNGVMQTGLAALPTGIYFFGADGAAVKGWLDVAEGKRYYFSDACTALVGLQKLGDDYYLFGNDGVMHTGWSRNEAGSYFFHADGKMATGLTPIGTSNYYFGADGRMTVGLVALKDGAAFFDAEGRQQVGWVQIGAGWFYFDPATGYMVKNTAIEIGGVPCAFDINGLLIAPVGIDPRTLQ